MTEVSENDVIIQGITKQGKTFRPSDWAERLSGILSSFDPSHRLSYNQHVHPQQINGISCVVIDKELEFLHPGMFRFLMDFAGDNNLLVCEGSGATEVGKTQIKSPERAAFVPIREIQPHETAQAFVAMSILRPNLSSASEFVEQVNGVLRANGYRLIGLFEEGREQALAVCGFRIKHNLAWGKYLNIDDLSTLPECRGQGFRQKLLDFIHEEAEKLGPLPVHLDSSVAIEQQGAHRLYFNAGYHIDSFHFVRSK